MVARYVLVFIQETHNCGARRLYSLWTYVRTSEITVFDAKIYLGVNLVLDMCILCTYNSHVKPCNKFVWVWICVFLCRP